MPWRAVRFAAAPWRAANGAYSALACCARCSLLGSMCARARALLSLVALHLLLLVRLCTVRAAPWCETAPSQRGSDESASARGAPRVRPGGDIIHAACPHRRRQLRGSSSLPWTRVCRRADDGDSQYPPRCASAAAATAMGVSWSSSVRAARPSTYENV